MGKLTQRMDGLSEQMGQTMRLVVQAGDNVAPWAFAVQAEMKCAACSTLCICCVVLRCMWRLRDSAQRCHRAAAMCRPCSIGECRALSLSPGTCR